MKFGQGFQAALGRDEYPKEWIESAISYKKLKKCIKRVQQELLSLGLDQDTLNALWQHVGSGASEHLANGDNSDRRLHYSLNGDKKVKFTPKLTIAIDPRDGSPMDAWLTPETKRALSNLAKGSRRGSQQTNGDIAYNHDAILPINEHDDGTSAAPISNGAPDASDTDAEYLETVEIPLTSDAEFFQILRRELKDLEQLQIVEQKQLQDEIVELGNDLRALKTSHGKRSKQEIDAWRKIFEMYTQAQVFLSSNEHDAGARDADHAAQHLQHFTKAVATQQGKNDLKLYGKEANAALDRFLYINATLLRLIRFQEINRTALTKIMKKFDKRTALHARPTLFSNSAVINGPLMSRDLAKATSFTISEQLLRIIPQLDDYLCPVCFSITWKPVRLKCQHVFCIRCLVVMQQAKQSHCPLCRGDVVMEATSDDLDKHLMKFLKENFKQEVKDKQKQNEIAAGVDRWGAQYEQSQKCVVM